MTLDSLMVYIGWPLIKIVILLAIVATCVAYTVYIERRVLGFFQSRVGPKMRSQNRPSRSGRYVR